MLRLVLSFSPHSPTDVASLPPLPSSVGRHILRSFKKFVAAAAAVAVAAAAAARVAVPCRLLSADVPRQLWHLDYRPAVEAELS